jgi:FkbM family methyltransferase
MNRNSIAFSSSRSLIGGVKNKIKKALLVRGLFIGRASEVSEYRMSKDIIDKHEVSIILDIGANSGQYGKCMRLNGYRNWIFSYEPDPNVFKTLEKNTANDTNWKVFNLALVDGDEERMQFFVSTNSGFSSSLLKSTEKLLDIYPKVTFENSIEVQCKRFDRCLDDLTSEKGVFIKADIQGFEKRLFISLDLEKYQNVVGVMIEVSLIPLYEGEWGIAEAINHFTNSGFRLVGIASEDYRRNFGTIQVNLFFEKTKPRASTFQ